MESKVLSLLRERHVLDILECKLEFRDKAGLNARRVLTGLKARRELRSLNSGSLSNLKFFFDENTESGLDSLSLRAKDAIDTISSSGLVSAVRLGMVWTLFDN